MWADQELDDPGLPITMAELEAASVKLPSGKSPGPDGIYNEVLKDVVRWNPALFLRAFDACIRCGSFPATWKRARVVLLYKGSVKPVDQPGFFRPISLLDGAGKIFEILILNRILPTVSSSLSPSQFGFRPGRGTVKAVEAVLAIAADVAKGVVQDRNLCVLVTLDVRNAFNPASWRRIDAAVGDLGSSLYIRKILRSYMSERTILVNAGGSVNERVMACGVPQGSVLGPTLWNIFYDGLLHIRLPPGASLLGFDDDVALAVVDHTTEGIERIANDALRRIDEWIRDNGLNLAHEKIEAIMLTRKWAYRKPIILSGGLPVEVKRTARYLGVLLNSKLTFVPHLKIVLDRLV